MSLPLPPVLRARHWLALLSLFCLALLLLPAHAASLTLTPASYQSTRGSDSGQSAASTLAIRDQSGSTNTWGKYIEFTPASSGGYIGTQAFSLPATVTPASVTALQVQANYQGPASATQAWTWKIRNWTTNAWTSLGTNAGAPSWGAWKLFTFNLGSAVPDHVRASDGRIELQLTSSNSADSADIDYTAIVVTHTAGGGGGDVTGITVSPTSTSVATGQTRQFTAVVQGGSNQAVNWSVNGVAGGNAGIGTVSTSGLYTAPASLPTPATVTVQAASAAAPARTASASVTLTQATAPAGPLRYVATDGNDNNAGTLAAPWKTIGHAAGVVQPGETVYVRGGVYEEIVRLRRSGQAGSPITIQSHPGERAIIEGQNQIVDGEVGLVTLENVSHVTFAGFEVRNFRTTSADAVPLGIMVLGAGTDIAVRNNLIHDIANTSSDVENRNAYGLAVFGTGATASLKNVTIDGNELHTLTLGNSESMTINGNVEFWTVSNNIVRDTDNIGIDAIGWEGRAGDGNTTTDYARDGVIRGNLVYRVSSSKNPAYGTDNYSAGGIYVDGGARILIEQNTVHHTDYGIELASEAEGQATNNVILRNNLIWASSLAAITVGGYEEGVGATENVTIVNNTLLLNNTFGWEAEFQMQYNASKVTFRNNIVHTTAENSFLSNTTNATFELTMDNNLYYSASGAASARFVWGREYTSFAAWQRIGKDATSRFANPLLASANVSAPNLKPQAGSPAIGTGVNLGAAVVGTLDVAGQARVQGAIDIGAYEQ